MPYLKFDPSAFVVESTRLEQRIIEASTQQLSYDRFKAKPDQAMTYIVAGNPDDRKAKYFAFHLAELHLLALGSRANVVIETIMGNFENKLTMEKLEFAPTLILMSNLTVRSSNLKFDKTRDLLERFPRIPKILVVAGEDPISFAATRLHSAVHGIAYFGNSISKTMNEVI